MEAIKKETFARNKAETIAKTLKETIEAQKEFENIIHGSKEPLIEEMEIDDDSEEWTEANHSLSQFKHLEELFNVMNVRANLKLKVI